MIALIFAALFLYLLYCRPYRRNLFCTGEYMSLQRTTMLNGIFIIIVFLRHIGGYIPGHIDMNAVDMYCFSELLRSLKQLLVAGFFFYSGFGIMESITRKEKGYLNQLPWNRFFRVLLYFDIAILWFWLMRELMGTSIHWEDVLLAFTGWGGIGNSNWFIFDTLCLYLITYVSFRWCGKMRWVALWGGCFLLLGLLMIYKEKQIWWYDTFLAFPAGMTFSFYRTKVEHYLACTKIPAPLYGALFIILSFVLIHPSRYNAFSANLASILTAYGTVLLLAYVDFRKSPRILIWMGGALFSLYIYQRIPMYVLSKKTDILQTPAFYILVCLVLTILIALESERLYRGIDKLLFSTRKK